MQFFQILKKEQIYDQHGHAGVDGRYSSEDIFQGARGDFSDLFGEVVDLILFLNPFLVGGGGFSLIRQQQRGSDLLYETQ